MPQIQGRSIRGFKSFAATLTPLTGLPCHGDESFPREAKCTPIRWSATRKVNRQPRLSGYDSGEASRRRLEKSRGRRYAAIAVFVESRGAAGIADEFHPRLSIHTYYPTDMHGAWEFGETITPFRQRDRYRSPKLPPSLHFYLFSVIETVLATVLHRLLFRNPIALTQLEEPKFY